MPMSLEEIASVPRHPQLMDPADPEELIDYAARPDVAYAHKASMLQDVEARRQTEGAGGDAGLQHVATIHLKSPPMALSAGEGGHPTDGMSEPSRINPHRTRQRSVPEAGRIAGQGRGRQRR